MLYFENQTESGKRGTLTCGTMYRYRQALEKGTACTYEKSQYHRSEHPRNFTSLKPPTLSSSHMLIFHVLQFSLTTVPLSSITSSLVCRDDTRFSLTFLPCHLRSSSTCAAATTRLYKGHYHNQLTGISLSNDLLTTDLWLPDAPSFFPQPSLCPLRPPAVDSCHILP